MVTRWKTELIDTEVEIDFENLRNLVHLKKIDLLRSNLVMGLYFNGVPREMDLKETYIEFTITPNVGKENAVCFLEVSIHPAKNVKEISGDEGHRNCDLKIEIMGEFSIDKKANPDDVEYFLQTEGLKALWPYVQDYASGQIKRTEYGEEPIPDIDPEELLENITDQLEYYDHEKEGWGDGYLRVEIHRDGTNKVWAF